MRVSDGPSGTGVVVARKEGFAYVLTAAHVVTLDGVTLEFTSRERYPKVAWSVAFPDVEVLHRWADPDIALLRFAVPRGRTVPMVPLAARWQRPKHFPAPAWSVGIGGDGLAVVNSDRIRAKVFVRRPDRGPAFFWELDKPGEPGRSGGPLLDQQGRVIGVCAANRNDRGHFAHLDEILAALKRDGYGWLAR